MAATAPPPKGQEDFKEEFLTCSICAELYDGEEHKAKFLPCLHSFCKSCLHKHAKKQPIFECPLCRNKVQTPKGEVDNLPANFIVENLMAYKDSFKSSVLCGSCDKEGTIAVSFCHNCGYFLCHACHQNHQTMRPLRDHKLSTMEELREKKYNPKMQAAYCQKHPEKKLTMFCSEDKCKVPICDMCGHVDHRGHKLAELAVIASDIIKNIQQSCAQSQERNQELIKKRAAVEALKESLTKNFTKKKKDLQKSEQNLYDKMHTRCSEAHKELQEMYDAEMQHMNKKIESIDSLSAQMTSACEFATTACDMSLPTQLLSSHKQIMNRLTELEKMQLPETESLQTDITFTPLHFALMQLFQVFLLHIWSLYLGPKSRYLRKGYWKLIIGAMLGFFILSSIYFLTSSPNLSEVDPAHSRIVLGKSLSTVGYYKATIQSIDTNGQFMTTGGASIVASQLWNSLPIKDNKNGRYTLTYSSLLGDVMYVRINGKSMKGSPFNVPKEIDPSQCTIQLQQEKQDIKGLNIGPMYKATLQTITYDGKLITSGGARIDASQLKLPLDVQDNNDGTYKFEYYPSFGAIHVKVNGKTIAKSPFYDLSEIDPKLCTINSKQMSKRIRTATVQTVASSGQLIKTNGTDVKAAYKYCVPKIEVHDANDGTYWFDYDSGCEVTVTINGERMKESPFYDHIEPDPSQCTIQLQQDKRDVEGLNIGNLYKATIQTVDYLGRNITTGGARVGIRQLNFELIVQDNNDGTYEFEYFPIFGAIHVNINGKPIRESPFYDFLKADPKLCTIQTESIPNSNFRKAIVQTVDSSGYPMKTGGTKVKALDCGSACIGGVHDGKDGTYWFEYYNNCRLTVTINGEHIKGSPFKRLD
ncbi:tripartite motif-containing protein 3-like [Amphiura filiformis]|uniref:tripartite motif-containing protein 3-like n=1 Tax=Amphiura filiformis TaxID=82378 RepID=UPI003B211841